MSNPTALFALRQREKKFELMQPEQGEFQYQTQTLRGDVADGLMFHADRGTQFTNEKLWEVCRNLGIA
ncbi:transposase family protein [Corynebacterium sp. EPI-003-04-2554_SCH2473622]|uniref:transposase family protein n=1 Tax=Corynebacterium sp. EPI-003-04-2554_SCH2473622 TaxID=1834153 RepID=UPI001E4D042A|nr:transposase family protein [Corynebacterium sp. EPI-003-04-2554_SCH2473622]